MTLILHWQSQRIIKYKPLKTIIRPVPFINLQTQFHAKTSHAGKRRDYDPGGRDGYLLCGHNAFFDLVHS
jgi:hypothetical protein